MSWRIATEHRSRYRYAQPVVASYNEVRITPIAFERQAVVESSVSVEPLCPLYTYYDYWSTVVVAFDVEQTHEELLIVGSSLVDTAAPIWSDPGIDWMDLRDPKAQDQFAEFLFPTRFTQVDDELAAIAAQLADVATPRDALEQVDDWVRSSLTYQRGTTDVSTSALQAWRQGSGVCQDFAHLGLSLLRSMGIPARYVSGYLHPEMDAAIGESAWGASHAWLEAWFGYWHPIDPTSGDAVGERHVTVARGRDYADVAPSRGVYHGGRLENLEVSVELTRLA